MYASSSSYGPPYSSTGIEFVAGMYNSIVNPMLSIWGENYGAYGESLLLPIHVLSRNANETNS